MHAIATTMVQGPSYAPEPSIEVTAAKETYVPVYGDPNAQPKDHFIERDGRVYAGTHLIIDLWGAHRLDDLDRMDQALRNAVEVAGATLLHIHLHHFTPNGGISGVAVLAESHISVHTWPERDYAAFDVFMCGDAQPAKAIAVLEEMFQPDRLIVKRYLRGEVEETMTDTNILVEALYDGYAHQLRIDKLYFEQHTEHQHLLIFENAMFGRVLALDDIVQTTEKDEFIYHEMLAHVPLMAHGNAARILIIGGGDGGLLRELVKHDNVTDITQVEIDGQVIELSKQYLPNHSQGAFDDPRWHLVIQDGMAFVRDSDATYDVIIVDSTDPMGPGEVLFSSDFYAACQQRLNPGGVLVTQNGVAFVQTQVVINTAKRFQALFPDWHFYSAAVPSYTGGIMAFGWASDNAALRQVPLTTLRERYAATQLQTRY